MMVKVNLNYKRRRPEPTLKEETDVVVRILKTTICGTDLHILRNNVATFKEGSILVMKALELLKLVVL